MNKKNNANPFEGIRWFAVDDAVYGCEGDGPHYYNTKYYIDIGYNNYWSKSGGYIEQEFTGIRKQHPELASLPQMIAEMLNERFGSNE